MSSTQMGEAAALRPTLPESPVPGLLRALPADLVDLHLACAFTGHGTKTLLTMARKGDFPAIYAMGNNVHKVSADDFKAWVEDARVGKGDAMPSKVKAYRLDRGRQSAS